ncbi:hypothetical protein ACOMHN_038679 [Nucella lapillus]
MGRTLCDSGGEIPIHGGTSNAGAGHGKHGSSCAAQWLHPDMTDKKKRIIKAAASLIQSDIASLPSCKEKYPDSIAIKDHIKSVPESLRAFLQHVTRAETSVKSSAIGQAIIQLSRPNTVIAPLQFGLGVLLHRSFASRFLVDLAFHLGFSSSYTEVRKFERNAAHAHGIRLPETTENTVIQYVADNVDHDTATLDGRGTFHGMGIIASVTPGVKAARRVPRRDVSLKDIKAIGQIKIHFFRGRSFRNSSLSALGPLVTAVEFPDNMITAVEFPENLITAVEFPENLITAVEFPVDLVTAVEFPVATAQEIHKAREGPFFWHCSFASSDGTLSI